MDRLQRVARLWNWLPVFRVVAETEHVNGAAKLLHLSPSAVSRTIKLLEGDLGQQLFRRIGRNLELTDAGRELLAVTRESMRRVDDSLDIVCGTKWQRTLRIASMGRLTTVYLLPALRRLRRECPGIVPHVIATSSAEIERSLLRGQLDVALTHIPLSHDALSVVVLGSATNGVYCGPNHPLYEVDTLDVATLIAHPFAAPEPRAGMTSIDAWPAEVPRLIGLYSSVMDGGIEACAHGDLLAVFPDRIVSTFACASVLRRLPIEIVPPQTLYAVKRRDLSASRGPIDLLLASISDDVGDRAAA
jgi:DNA-binding transcriptional LysR family regulator